MEIVLRYASICIIFAHIQGDPYKIMKINRILRCMNT